MFRFRKLKISTSLYLLLMMFCVMQVISSGISLGIIHLNNEQITRVDLDTSKRDELGLSWASLIQTRNAINRVAIAMKTEQSTDYIQSIESIALSRLETANTHFQNFLAEINKEAIPTEEKEIVEAVKNDYRVLYGALTELHSMLKNDNFQGFLDQPTERYQTAMENSFNTYMNYVQTEITESIEQGHRSYTIAILMFIGAIAMIIVVSIAAHRWLSFNIIKPFASLSRYFNDVATGKLNREILVFTDDEIGDVFRQLRDMRGELARSIRIVRDNSHAMYSGIQEISKGNTDLSSRTEQQAASLEETAASMEELTATVKQNADNALQASKLAESASETAMRGGQITHSVVETMDAITQSSQKIGAIISVIDGIAFQTNILALNAAVEAARAGEQGRGFSVVAGEVRNLAQRSADAAKEIKLLIDESVLRVSQGSQLVNNAGQTMEELVTSVNKVTELMAEIASASDEQSRGIHQVADAVSQMDQVTQQNAALVEQSASAAAALEDQANNLVDAVSAFELPDTDENNTSSSLEGNGLKKADKKSFFKKTH
ncbi:HAMP domain-containing protein [Proteus sp. G2669]|uniref:methyl-accepting chemotaxis protein n=1 Tax=unclassified Proteus (in: enterobacteria) TaxID=257482 RepID=UPI0014121A6F|nr:MULTISPECIES: methyl-accepting chemotaxis protein [unclassified Proteus (in: enterobacteria)]NBM54324.1 HAMP domain-containing protein [Proteus sp. G2669]UDN34633.1 methyl-accepting chemotaxis protein [Proteus sp. NMG38-2]